MTEIEKVIELLQKTNYLLNIIARNDIKQLLEDALNSDEKKIAYNSSDGINTLTMVKDIAGVSAGSISNWWAEWIRIGLAEKLPVMGGTRAKRKYDLSFYGIQTSTGENDEF
ncbi:MAG: hypothetical protein ACTSW1_06540 [Candidatus Hodarchaeales archaeon]